MVRGYCTAFFARYRTLRTMLHKQRNYALAKGMKLPDTSALQKQREAAAKAKADEVAEAQRKLREAAELMDRQKAAMKAAQPDSDDDADDDVGGGSGGALRLGGLDALTKGAKKDDASDASSVMSAYSEVRPHACFAPPHPHTHIRTHTHARTRPPPASTLLCSLRAPAPSIMSRKVSGRVSRQATTPQPRQRHKLLHRRLV